MEFERLFALAQSLVSLVKCVKHPDVKSVICYKNEDYDALNMVLPIRQHVTYNNDTWTIVQQIDNDTYDILPYQFTKMPVPRRVSRNELKCLQSRDTMANVPIDEFVKQCEQMAVYYIIYCCYLNCAPTNQTIDNVYKQLGNIYDNPNDGEIVKTIHEKLCPRTNWKTVNINKINELNKSRVNMVVKELKLRVNDGKANIGTNHDMNTSELLPEFSRFQLVYKDGKMSMPVSLKKYICASLGIDFKTTVDAINVRVNKYVNPLYEYGINVLLRAPGRTEGSLKQKLTGINVNAIKPPIPPLKQGIRVGGKSKSRKGKRGRATKKRKHRYTKKHGGVLAKLTYALTAITAAFNGNLRTGLDSLGFQTTPEGLKLLRDVALNQVAVGREAVPINMVDVSTFVIDKFLNSLLGYGQSEIVWVAANGNQLRHFFRPELIAATYGQISGGGSYLVAFAKKIPGIDSSTALVGAALGYVVQKNADSVRNDVGEYMPIQAFGHNTVVSAQQILLDEALAKKQAKERAMEKAWEQAQAFGENYQNIVAESITDANTKIENAKMWDKMIQDSGIEWAKLTEEQREQTIAKLQEFNENHTLNVDPFLNMLKQIEIDQQIVESARTGIDETAKQQIFDAISYNMDEVQRVAGDFYTASLIYETTLDNYDIPQEQKEVLLKELNHIRETSDNLDTMVQNMNEWMAKGNRMEREARFNAENQGALVATDSGVRTHVNEKVAIPPMETLVSRAVEPSIATNQMDVTNEYSLIQNSYKVLLGTYATVVALSSESDAPVFSVRGENKEETIITPDVTINIQKKLNDQKRYLAKLQQKLSELLELAKTSTKKLFKEIERVKKWIAQTVNKIATLEQQQEPQYSGSSSHNDSTDSTNDSEKSKDWYVEFAAGLGILGATTALNIGLAIHDIKQEDKRKKDEAEAKEKRKIAEEKNKQQKKIYYERIENNERNAILNANPLVNDANFHDSINLDINNLQTNTQIPTTQTNTQNPTTPTNNTDEHK